MRRRCDRAALGVFGIDEAEGGLKAAMGDARLGVHRLEVKDCDTGGLTASAGLCGTRVRTRCGTVCVR